MVPRNKITVLIYLDGSGELIKSIHISDGSRELIKSIHFSDGSREFIIKKLNLLRWFQIVRSPETYHQYFTKTVVILLIISCWVVRYNITRSLGSEFNKLKRDR